jgi:hypothetical protein
MRTQLNSAVRQWQVGSALSGSLYRWVGSRLPFHFRVLGYFPRGICSGTSSASRTASSMSRMIMPQPMLLTVVSQSDGRPRLALPPLLGHSSNLLVAAAVQLAQSTTKHRQC